MAVLCVSFLEYYWYSWPPLVDLPMSSSLFGLCKKHPNQQMPQQTEKGTTSYIGRSAGCRLGFIGIGTCGRGPVLRTSTPKAGSFGIMLDALDR